MVVIRWRPRHSNLTSHRYLRCQQRTPLKVLVKGEEESPEAGVSISLYYFLQDYLKDTLPAPVKGRNDSKSCQSGFSTVAPISTSINVESNTQQQQQQQGASVPVTRKPKKKTKSNLKSKKRANNFSPLSQSTGRKSIRLAQGKSSDVDSASVISND